MILVLFEVTIKEACMNDYLALASELKVSLNSANGFIRSERFSSLVNQRKLLSLSVWESEAAVNNWRNQQDHRNSQKNGRNSMFESYNITVASALRSYTDTKRQEAPADSNIFFDSTDNPE